MIKSFKDKLTEDIFHGNSSSKTKRIPNDLLNIILRKLDQLNAVTVLNDLKVPPGNRLEKLKGNLANYHSIRVNQQFRIIFIWENGNASDVCYIDYH